MLMPTADVPARIVAPQTTAITLVFTVAVADVYKRQILSIFVILTEFFKF